MNWVRYFEHTTLSMQRLDHFADDFQLCVIALWNLRCEVKGYLSENPKVSDKELENRYFAGLRFGMRYFGFREAFDATWDSQVSSYSWKLIGDACAVFEEWLDKIVDLAHVNAKKKEIVKGLQFPRGWDSKQPSGSDLMAEVVKNNLCKDAADAFKRAFVADEKYDIGTLDELLLCYQVFKKFRNAYMHSGSIASKECVSVFKKYSAIKPVCTIGTKNNPVVDDLTIGKIIVPKYRSVVGFTDVVMRLIGTYDVEFIGTTFGESEFVRRFKEAIPKVPLLRGDIESSRRQVAGFAKRIYNRSNQTARFDEKAIRRILERNKLCRIPCVW